MKAMKVALYARVSTNDKDQNPETQLRPLREHARTLADAEVVGEFVDRASADDLRGRRAWRQLLEAALQRQVDLIVVWRLDRAFRSVVDGATTLQTLRSSGCGIRTLQEPWIDTTTPIGEAMYHITIAWAQLDRLGNLTWVPKGVASGGYPQAEMLAHLLIRAKASSSAIWAADKRPWRWWPTPTR
jgi:DNA invertase Pin-like site-specific DNA recombinase